jgi:PAS domain-containing protein
MGSDRTALLNLQRLEERLAHCQEALSAAEGINRRLAADQKQLSALIDGTRDAIWSSAPDGTILRWNLAAQRLFGYATEEIIGRSVLQLVPADRKKAALEVLEKLKEGASYGQHETVRLRKGWDSY